MGWVHESGPRGIVFHGLGVSVLNSPISSYLSLASKETDISNYSLIRLFEFLKVSNSIPRDEFNYVRCRMAIVVHDCIIIIRTENVRETIYNYI